MKVAAATVKFAKRPVLPVNVANVRAKQVVRETLSSLQASQAAMSYPAEFSVA